MRLARIATDDGPRPVVWERDSWHGVQDIFAPDLVRTGVVYSADSRLLAPVEPRVILGMAHNSGAADRELPPQAFLKSARTANDPEAPIGVDPRLGVVAAEGELAVVIRRHARHLDADSVAGVILGYTIGNDVTATDQVAVDEKMTQSKNGDGFTPLGPWIETDLDLAAAEIVVEVDGVRVAGGRPADLAYDITEQLVYLSSVLALGPGDVVLTGAPGTAAPVLPGDRVRIGITGIGTLENTVVDSRPRASRPVVLMGVSGSGKSTVGVELAALLDVPFVDADDLHPPANKAKMAAGVPLTDDDRAPWLRVVGERLSAADGGVVLACSALKRRYRTELRAHAPNVLFAHLDGSPDLLASRLAERSHEYMPATLLASQLGALEPLAADEDGVVVSIESSVEGIARSVAATARRTAATTLGEMRGTR